MKKRIIVKLTSQQLNEAQDDAFTYLTNSDTTPNNGQTEISVNGKIDGKEDGNPLTTDKFASMTTSQGYNRYGGIGNNIVYNNIIEDNDKNNDGIDDFYNNPSLDILSNGNEDDNMEEIPYTIDEKTNILLSFLKKISPKKQAIVLNKIIENINLKGIPYKFKKELIKKLSLRYNDTFNQ